MIHLIEEPIQIDRWRLKLPSKQIGAAVEFSGIVRDLEKGKSIEALVYEIYPGMAQQELEKIEHETRRQYPIEEICLVHRYGKIPVGETALWVQIFSAHRAPAFEALEFCISRLKEVVPIWKAVPSC